MSGGISPYIILAVVAAYFAVLLCISRLTTRRLSADSFYLANRRNPWYIIAAGMLGSSISGVSFVSVPGMVKHDGFSYMQMVFGFVAGYAVVAQVLLPLYYKLGLTSIYTYLERRLGKCACKTGASFFLLSRLAGAAIRMLAVAGVLQVIVFDRMGVPFSLNVIVTVALIFLYTNKGGVKTVIWTDLLQTLVMLTALVITICYVADALGLSLRGAYDAIRSSEWSQALFFDDAADRRYFWKQFAAGVFTVIAMTGLDQDAMQKNISCRTLRDAQRNMYCYGMAFVPVNLLFLSLGALLYTFMAAHGMTAANPDSVFPLVATSGLLPAAASVLFITGIVAAAWSSADSTLASLTTSFTIDIAGIGSEDALLPRKRKMIHLAFSAALVILILLMRKAGGSLIYAVYTAAGYTYGPLLGMFAFGLCSKVRVRDRWTPAIAVAAPVATLLICTGARLYFGYEFGFELLLLNALLAFAGMWAIACLSPRTSFPRKQESPAIVGDCGAGFPQ